MHDSIMETIRPGPRAGVVSIPASKSRAHRLLICAALSGAPSRIGCRGISNDIQATANCLRALGAGVDYLEKEAAYIVRPISKIEKAPISLPCGESGSTLRFLLPLVGALGAHATFRMEGRLPERPLSPLKELLEQHGMTIRRDNDLLRCSGKLTPGDYAIPGNISSQYVSGLLFALPLLSGESRLRVTGIVESADYITMTEDALSLAGFHWVRESAWSYRVPGGQVGTMPDFLSVESDWSSAAFFLALGALSPAGVTVRGMNPDSLQGDRAILNLLSAFGAEVTVFSDQIHVRHLPLKGISIQASAIPDLVPVLSAIACAAEGTTVIHGAERLRMKESDRLQATTAMLSSLGADIHETADGLIIHGKSMLTRTPAAASDIGDGSAASQTPLAGGQVSSFGDHRIAMAAAVAAALCSSPVIVEGAQCTDKSFPGFWQTLNALPVISH